MATLTSVPGLEVDINIAGHRAREHIHPTKTLSRANGVLKYVEAQSGNDFAITIRVQSPFDIETSAIVARVVVDGISVLGPLFRKERYDNQECLLSHTIHGKEVLGLSSLLSSFMVGS
jgi:hypothetical protein